MLRKIFAIGVILVLLFTIACAKKQLNLDNKANPLYVNTKNGLTIINTKEDNIIIEGFSPSYSYEIAAFYKTLLFSDFSGTDFPVNKPPATHVFDLKTGKSKKVAKAQLSFLKKEGRFLYGLGVDYELIFIYDIAKKRFIKVYSSDNDLEPTFFVGFIKLKHGPKGIVLSNIDDLEVRSLDGQKQLAKRTTHNSAAAIVDNNKIIVLGYQDLSIVNLDNKEITNFPAKLDEHSTIFYAYRKLFIGKSTSASEKPNIANYRVYNLNGKLIKRLKIDVRDYNNIKINQLLVFLGKPHKGYALNLKTAEMVRVNIPEQSVIQDKKLYSVENNKLFIRSGNKLLKRLELDSQIQKTWEDDISIYNRAIFSSQPTNDNFRIIESL